VPYVNKFCQDESLEYKALLLVDNTPAHPSHEKLTSRDNRVTTMFLPPNTTSILQPLDQGLLEAMKRRYKKSLLRHIIFHNSESSLPVPDIVKGLTIKDAVYWSAQAWEDISPMTIKKCWKKLIPTMDRDENDTSHSSENAPSVSNDESSVDGFAPLFHQLSYSETNENWQNPSDWLNEDSTDPGYQLKTDSEIVADVTGGRANSDTESEDETVCEDWVSNAQAFEAFQTALKWLERQPDTDHIISCL
jgi:hypothetical protein